MENRPKFSPREVLHSSVESSVHQHPKDGGSSNGQGGVNCLRGLDGYQQNDDAGDELMYEGIVLEEPNKLGEEGVGLEDRDLI